MSVLQITPMTVGAVGVKPQGWQIFTDDTFSTVTTAGYLTEYDDTNNFESTQFAFVYTTDLGVVYLTLSVSSGVVSLVNTSDSQVITYPVTQNYLAVFSSTSSTSSTIKNGATTAINPGSLQLGLSGTLGQLSLYPSTASRGNLAIVPVNNTGNTVTTISNAAMGQASTISIPDPGASSASFVLNTGDNTMASSSTIVLAKNVATESGNAVTINQQSGVITTSSLTTASGSSYSITFTNSKITSTSLVLLSLMGGTNTISGIQISSESPSSGTVVIVIANNSSSALNGTLKIGFAIF